MAIRSSLIIKIWCKIWYAPPYWKRLWPTLTVETKHWRSGTRMTLEAELRMAICCAPLNTDLSSKVLESAIFRRLFDNDQSVAAGPFMEGFWTMCTFSSSTCFHLMHVNKYDRNRLKRSVLFSSCVPVDPVLLLQFWIKKIWQRRENCEVEDEAL